MAVVKFQQDNLAVASPKDHARLAAIGINRDCVGNDCGCLPRPGRKIQAGTAALAPLSHAQRFDRANPVSGNITHGGVIEEPANHGCFVCGNRAIHVASFPSLYASRNSPCYRVSTPTIARIMPSLLVMM